MKILQGIGAVIIAVTGWGTMGLLARLIVCGLSPDLGPCQTGPAGWFVGALGVGVVILVVVFAFVTVVYISASEKERSQNS
jgi:hypothetical protein